ncbi:MAG: dipZ, partial [Nocardioidaceae bacterium]|nr:dipZ [Nocardioidaceae bacterium]
TLARCGRAPALRGVTDWLNTPGGDPVPQDELSGHVVLLEFFSTACAPCRRDEAYLSALDDAYHRYGLRVIGVDSAQFPFERRASDVRAALEQQQVRYPVALDPRGTAWRSYRAGTRPARYLVDQQGVVRAISLAEGGFGTTENLVRALLLEGQRPGTQLSEPAVPNVVTDDVPRMPGDGVTQDTQLGVRPPRYTGSPVVRAGTTTYERTAIQPDDTFSLGGSWRVRERSMSAVDEASIRVTVHARKVWLVVSGGGSITVHHDGLADSVQPVTTPGAYQLLDADQVVERRLDIDLPPGTTVHAIEFG